MRNFDLDDQQRYRDRKNSIAEKDDPFELKSFVVHLFCHSFRSKHEGLAMLDGLLKFEKEFRIFSIVLRLLVVLAGKLLYALVTVPFGHRPEVTNIAFDPPPYLDAQISVDRFIIRDAGVDDELKIFIRELGLRAPMPDAGYDL